MRYTVRVSESADCSPLLKHKQTIKIVLEGGGEYFCEKIDPVDELKKSKLYGWQCFECDKLDDSDHESVVPPKAPLKSRTRNSSLEFEKSPETPAESTSVVSVAPTSQPKRPRKSGTGDNPMEANGIETKKMLLKIPKIGQELSEKLSAEEISVEMLAPKAAAPQVNEAVRRRSIHRFPQRFQSRRT
ncbi:uncharacterized protein LOC119767098 [Culex quinquefasciatus]|uniref:uncharacterized protein LOC119767098 n=1 Tax=Culex quinquefasciatus TaxID=7176 RepID=UPI0018E32133|nr:uncharacterized protein LOC119767098 [Culex quinquefasciatus]